jgi:hypothetical protein
MSQNESHYCFYQYNESSSFQITRPVNSKLIYDFESFKYASTEYRKILKSIRSVDKNDTSIREIINRMTSTLQQSIGCTLDGLEVGKSNTARKLNGDLFENLILLIINKVGIKCGSETIKLPVKVDDKILFSMKYQHGLVVKKGDDISLIGSIKTSSKDRIDKVFIDKFLYNKLTETETPHIVIFLHDVQRKNAKKENKYGISSAFLLGHFKGYTVKLNPLDGVYYCDIRPSMLTEDILKDHIKTFDNLLIEDIWKFVN